MMSGGAWILQATLEKVRARIAVSEEARRTVVEHLGGDAVLVPNGIDVERFARAEPRPEWSGPGTMAFVGRVDEPRKGLAVLLEALPQIAAEHPGARLFVAGPGELMFPNGTVITPDGRTLIVAETLGARLTAFDVAADGTLSNRRVWAEVPGRAPDGICLDADGAVWLADALGSDCVRVAEGGDVLATVTPSQTPFACMLGGPDGRTLFMCTAASSAPTIAAHERAASIEITEVAVPRAGWP